MQTTTSGQELWRQERMSVWTLHPPREIERRAPQPVFRAAVVVVRVVSVRRHGTHGAARHSPPPCGVI